MYKPICIFLFFTWSKITIAQEQPDTVSLNEVIVHAYNQEKKLLEAPVAVHAINQHHLHKISSQTLLPALNALPGVRMEQRSPGSYRLNIRGSSLRSPFGVRNVKTYYNQVPYTEPGGITYLNQLSLQQMKSVEIIKGPGSSVYGAGNGGVLLINSFPASTGNFINAGFDAGSFGYRSIYAEAQAGNENIRQHLLITHQASGGYRDHSNMERNTATYDLHYKTGRNALKAFLLAGYLYYQTPGALNLNEYNNNPKKARPRAGPVPGAAENHAAIHQQMILTGMHNVFYINPEWQHQVSIYGSIIQLTNPNIRNYEQSSIPHTGGRSSLSYDKPLNRGSFNWQAGAEWQQSFSQVKSYLNNSGNKGPLQASDAIRNRQHFIFTQATFNITNWVITGGLSLNNAKTVIEKDLSAPPAQITYAYHNILAPRIAILKKIKDRLAIYANIAKGFSPPATAEVFPSGGAINLSLQPETGINYEAGMRYSGKKNLLSVQSNIYYFELENTIVQRRDASGGDYYINAGATGQKGIELLVSYRLQDQLPAFIQMADLSSSYSFSLFKYKDFKQFSNDFSGNRLPGIPPHTFNQQATLVLKNGFYINASALFSDVIYLNDANNASSDSYWLVQLKTGYRLALDKTMIINLYAGADNILNQQYSLGNDINGFGGRYFNTAPNRNFFAGGSFQF